MDKPELKPWTVLESRPLFKDRWIDVRSERCRTAGGMIVDPFYVYHRPDWACILAVDERDHAVVVRSYRHGIAGESLELPAGVIDPEDASPEAAVRRELLEETGFVCGAVLPVARLANNPSNMTSYAHIFIARGATRHQDPQLEAGESLHAELMPIGDLRRAAYSGGIVHGMQTAAIILALEKLPRL